MGSRKRVNKGLKSWVTFVKKVQREEKISYKDAIHRAKQRKDKGEKWMLGGVGTPDDEQKAYQKDQLDNISKGQHDATLKKRIDEMNNLEHMFPIEYEETEETKETKNYLDSGNEIPYSDDREQKGGRNRSTRKRRCKKRSRTQRRR